MSRSKAVRYYSEEQVREFLERFSSCWVDPANWTDAALSLRPEVAAFAQAMEEKLRQNDHKQHWRGEGYDYLFRRLKEEVQELGEAIDQWHIDSSIGHDEAERQKQAAIRETADVANFALMIADVMGGLKGE